MLTNNVYKEEHIPTQFERFGAAIEPIALRCLASGV